MNKNIELNDIFYIMQEKLEMGGEVIFNPNGTSMLPTISEHGDRIVIKRSEGRLKKYDIAFYKRKDGSFVLHRIVKKPKEDYYEICGDNQWRIEKVYDNQIIAKVIGIYRKEKYFECEDKKYVAYVKIWVSLRIMRKIRDLLRKAKIKLK